MDTNELLYVIDARYWMIVAFKTIFLEKRDIFFLISTHMLLKLNVINAIRQISTKNHAYLAIVS